MNRPGRRSLGPVASGLVAGSLAAVVVALLNLPLHAPLDAYFNSATVVAAVMLTALGAGIVWARLHNRTRALIWFGGVAAGSGLVAIGLAGAAEALLSGSFAYVAPLATISIALIAFMIPVFDEMALPAPPALASAAVAIAVGVGGGLATQRDSDTGSLNLPTRATPATATAFSGVETSPTETYAAAATTAIARTYDGRRFSVSSGSTATFTVREQLVRLPLPNDAVLRTDALSGDVYLDGRPFSVQIDLYQLTSDQSNRDRYVRTQMFSRQRTATLTVPGIEAVPVSLAEGREVTLTVAGSLNINGGDYPVSFAIKARDDGDVIYVTGTTKFTWADLGLQTPRALSVVSVEDTVTAEVLLTLRPS